jgi:pimeloyl-ACP methyl ester carboxylesterase/CRP-like cAMP-binding protein
VTEQKSYYQDVNGQKVHIVEEGRPGRQVALLIHGWSSSWYAMSPLLGLLAQRFRAMAIDLPGYGDSPRLAKRTTISGYVDLLADLIVDLTDEPVVLVGHSMGGMISLTLALRHPALVERMVLISPTISGRLSPYINFVVSPITLLERFGLGSLIVSAFERTMVGLTDRIMRPASYAQRTGITREEHSRLQADVRRPGQGRVRAECFYAMRDNDLSEQLGAVQVPALVLWGAEDNTVPLRDAGVVADQWPDADLRILPKAGHWPHFERADITRRQVAAYLGLPRFSDQLHTSIEDSEWVRIREAAQFLAHSDLGTGLNLAQRMRLAAQCRHRTYAPRDVIVRTNEVGDELFIIQAGSVEVWSASDSRYRIARQSQLLHTFNLGEMVGEFALLEQGRRTADLVAGPEGATVFALTRSRLLALCEDDAVLGSQLLWNFSKAIGKRAVLINEQRTQILRRRETEAKATRPLPELEIRPVRQSQLELQPLRRPTKVGVQGAPLRQAQGAPLRPDA